jgi:hypothetical protein
LQTFWWLQAAVVLVFHMAQAAAVVDYLNLHPSH